MARTQISAWFGRSARRAAALLLLPLALSCSADPDDDSDHPAGGDNPTIPPAWDGDDGDGPDVDDDGPDSPPEGCLPATGTPMRELARRADSHLINYGTWSDDEIELAKSHDVVILDPDDDVTREQVAAIQAGDDPDDPCERVIVLCYISIGEDIRTTVVSDEQMRTDPRFIGDGTGPRRDPRGPYAAGEPLTGIDPRGLPSNGGTGYASWYLDDNDVHNGPGNVGDGKPDRNGNFNGAFVNAGDPKWFDALQDFTMDGPDGVAGLREILTTDYGRGLGCDGVFLDTIDTAAPNSWTDSGSSNETKYEWTAPGFGAFIQRLRSVYPDAVILQNRGVFFFNPLYEHYRFIPRGNVDYFLYESYRLNSSSSSNNPHHYYYPDNRFNFTPKLMAEANRPDGFRVLSVGYAEGPADTMSETTLVGDSTLGYDSLLEDIRVAERLAGFRHYLTNSSLTLVNRFVMDHADRADTDPPTWTSSYNDNNSYPSPPGEATPRRGIQQVVAGPGQLTLRWDVALDLNRVGYALYYQTTPFDFAADPELTSAVRHVLHPRTNNRYAGGVGPGSFPNEATVTNLVPGQTYHLVIRAFDESPAANEDDNQIVLTGVPAPGAPYLGRARAANHVSALTYRFQYAGSWTTRRVYIDRDRMAGTGYEVAGIGADLMIQENVLYRYTGSGTDRSWATVVSVQGDAAPIGMATGASERMTYVEWTLDRALVGQSYRHTSLVFEVERPGAVNTSTVHEHVYTPSDPSSPYLGTYAENDGARLYFHAEINAPFSERHIFIDDDADPTTGYPFAGVGAGYVIENGSLYRHVGPGWVWEYVGSAHESVSGAAHHWWISRADLGATIGSPLMKVVFQAQGEDLMFVAPIYAHQFSR